MDEHKSTETGDAAKTKTYTVKVAHDGRAVGSTVQLSDEDAKALVDEGKIAEVDSSTGEERKD